MTGLIYPFPNDLLTVLVALQDHYVWLKWSLEHFLCQTVKQGQPPVIVTTKCAKLSLTICLKTFRDSQII